MFYTEVILLLTVGGFLNAPLRRAACVGRQGVGVSKCLKSIFLSFELRRNARACQLFVCEENRRTWPRKDESEMPVESKTADRAPLRRAAGVG